MVEILNSWFEKDFHMHSFQYSDGLNTIDELVNYAWILWFKEIAITDHSQVVLDYAKFVKKSSRKTIKQYVNVLNDVKVVFWVECDLLDQQGNVCFDIQWIEWDFNVLSLHSYIFTWPCENTTQAYINAIEKYHSKIHCIWHPNIKKTSQFLDMIAFIEICNKYEIPLEFNCRKFIKWAFDMDQTKYMLKNAKYIILNSDAHMLWDLKFPRQETIKYLKENMYL